MGPMGFTHVGDWIGRGMSDDFREDFRRGNPKINTCNKGRIIYWNIFVVCEWDMKQIFVQ